jgi:hypothetical protein
MFILTKIIIIALILLQILVVLQTAMIFKGPDNYQTYFYAAMRNSGELEHIEPCGYTIKQFLIKQLLGLIFSVAAAFCFCLSLCLIAV